MPRGIAKKQDHQRKCNKGSGRKRRGGGWESSEVSRLNAQLLSLGLIKRGIVGDGNCLFASISDQHFGDPFRHSEIRGVCVEYMRSHVEDLRPFLLEEDLAVEFLKT